MVHNHILDYKTTLVQIGREEDTNRTLTEMLRVSEFLSGSSALLE